MIDKVGSYRVVRQLGEGGMGVVYEGIHDQIGRRAAIKVLHKEISQNPELLARFFNEARASNLVSHPSIVDVYEIGQLPDGRAYIIMQFLDGESLSARLQRLGGRLPVADAIRLARQIASGMATAHEKGIIHRDLKPDNVMVVADPEAVGGERVKIVDFGIAKVLTSIEESQTPIKTRAGTVLGTPAYMAPEQCRGAEGVTAKSDVYSLGAMLYEFLAGRFLFTASGTGEMLAKQIYEQPRPLGEIDASLPAELVTLVHAMLAKEPQARPAMTEVVTRLAKLGAASTDEHLLPTQSSPLTSRPTQSLAGSAAAAGMHASARRGFILGGALLLVGTAVGGGWLFAYRPDKRRLRALVAAPEQPLKMAERPAAEQSAAPAPVVHWSIVTEPPGVEVLRVADRERLGTTPWHHQQVAGQGSLPLLLQLPGYAAQSLTLPLDRDDRRQVAMVITEAAPTSPVPPSPPRRERDRPHASTRRRRAGVTDSDIKVVR